MTGEREINIRGDVTGSILITGDNNVVQGVTRLPTDYSTRIRNFILEYTGTPENPVPFGGREATLKELDDWLAGDDFPYLLLAAPAGRGKSALLVRWLERLRVRDPDLSIVFVPVSLRFNTSSQAVFFAALAARLAHLYGEAVPADLSTAPDIWRQMASDYMDRPPSDGRLLVVLDGLDEATEWEAGAELFSRQPPPGLRVAVSARYRADEQGPEGWLRRLGWERAGLARALDLDPLTRPGVADVLERMGFPLAKLGQRVDIVAELHRLSEGDPLLVRLYVDDLWARGEQAVRLQPEDLQELEPGLAGYFDRWWEDQRKQWGAQAPLKEGAVREVLNLLAAALGPLGRDDLLTLSQELDTWLLEDALQPLARMVIGDGREQGYIFSHPRLGQYFRDKLSPMEQGALEERFLVWGREILSVLKKGELAPREVPPYLVRALGDHLARAGALPKDWMKLVDGVWATTAELLEGTYGLFAHDLDRAWAACMTINAKKTAQGQLAPYVGEEIRCALVQASLCSLTGNWPPELIVGAVQSGLWEPRQATVYARLMPDESRRAEALAGLASFLAKQGSLQDALVVARASERKSARVHALADLASRLPGGLPPKVLEEALAVARELPRTDDHGSPRGRALVKLAPHFREGLQEQILEEALAAVGEISPARYQAEALVNLAPCMPGALLGRAVAVAKALPEYSFHRRRPRATALVGLIPHLAERRPQEAVAAVKELCGRYDNAQELDDLASLLAREGYPELALVVARKIVSKSDLVHALVGLIPYLPDRMGEQVLEESLAIARRLPRGAGTVSPRARALVSLIPHLPDRMGEQTLQEALVIARKVERELNRVHILIGLASLLSNEPLRVQTLVEALATVREMECGDSRAVALASLAPHLPERLLEEALTIAKGLPRAGRTSSPRVRALVSLTPHLPERLQQETFEETLVTIRETKSEDQRSSALVGLAPHLPERLLEEALVIAREIDYGGSRAEALLGLWQRFPEGLREQILEEILGALREMDYVDAHGVDVLTNLAPHIPERLQEKALMVVRGIRWEILRFRALAGLAPYLTKESLQQCLADTRGIHDEDDRAQSLVSLSRHLPKGLLEETPTVAKAIRGYSWIGAACSMVQRLKRLVLVAATGMKWRLTLILFLLGLPSSSLGDVFDQILSRLLDVAVKAGQKGSRARVLANCFPEWSFRWLLDALWRIGWHILEAWVLVSLIPYLPETLLERALNLARGIGHSEVRAAALAGLAPHLSEGLQEQALGQALAAAKEGELVPDDDRRGEILAALALLMAKLGYSQEALAIAREDRPGGPLRTFTLAALAPHLPTGLRKQAIQEGLSSIREIRYKESRVAAIVTLTPHLLALPHPVLYSSWAEVLPLLARRARRDLLSDLCAMAPVIAALGGEEAIAETFRAIQDVGRWWP